MKSETIIVVFLFQDNRNRLDYLLENYTLPAEDIELNCIVLNWPEKIMPVFDESDEVRSCSLLLPTKTVFSRNNLVTIP